MHIRGFAIFLISCLLCASLPLYAGENALEKIMPAPACVDGWNKDGMVTLYDKDSLFERINGEAELYFPYGFEVLAYARYENKANPKFAIDADVYKMGSLIDAFGMFANYRKKADADIVVGGQGTVSSSQLFFYQDKYFVRLQATGAPSVPKDVFLACARAISQNLPKNAERPKELEVFQVPGVAAKSERYIAQSVLGYEFFRKGVVADAIVKGEQVQVFLVIDESPERARKTLEEYRSYLRSSGGNDRTAGEAGRGSFEGVDPLYGNVYVQAQGRFVIGLVRLRDGAAAKQLVEQLRKKAAKM